MRKTCTRCGETGDAAKDFYKGYSYCKPCKKIQYTEYKKKRRDEGRRTVFKATEPEVIHSLQSWCVRAQEI